MYEIKLEIFEGPLDLLLSLVDKRKLDITEISLASIVGDYRKYLENLQKFSLEIESSFITVFASLLEIKSRLLLPQPPALPGEENEEEKEHELVVRLREYSMFKTVALEMEQKVRTAMKCHCRPVVVDSECIEETVLITQTSPLELMDCYVAVMRQFGLRQKTGKPLEMKVEDITFPFMYRLLSKKLILRGKVALFELFDSPPDRQQFIATFLVLLEMARRKKVNLEQMDRDQIQVSWVEPADDKSDAEDLEKAS